LGFTLEKDEAKNRSGLPVQLANVVFRDFTRNVNLEAPYFARLQIVTVIKNNINHLPRFIEKSCPCSDIAVRLPSLVSYSADNILLPIMGINNQTVLFEY
jgi:hypothetical protein